MIRERGVNEINFMKNKFAISKNVFALGLVSFFNDVA